MKHAELVMGEPVVVAVSPPEYAGDPAGRWWGFFQFPDLWRGRDNKLYLAVNVGADSEVGRHEPTQFFVSANQGKNWAPTAYSQVDLAPDIVELPDGSQITFGQARHIYHFAALSSDAPNHEVLASELGLKPVAGPLRTGYKVNEYQIYRYGDIPENLRRFPVAYRASVRERWQSNFGCLDFPDLQLLALSRAGWWDDNGRFAWKELPHRIKLPVPQETVSLPDGTLLWTHASQHPSVKDRTYYRVACLASTDRGRTWRLRGFIADDTAQTSWGYGAGEQSLSRMPNGELLCVMRTKMSNEAADTHYLTAARSKDGGFTWSTPVPIAPFSVTPHLLALKNGVVALIYGRPGVHVKISMDSGQTWGKSVPLVGPSEEELLAIAEWWRIRHDFSCANTTVVVTGPNRFLVAYSDFHCRGEDGKIRKGIKVREVAIGSQALETAKKTRKY